MEEALNEQLKKYAENLAGDERRDRTWFDELSAELQAHADRIEARLHRFYLIALSAMAVVGVCTALGLLGFGIVLKKQTTLAHDIQQQRYNSILDNCQDTNHRHDKVIRKIDMAIADTPAAQRKQAEKGAKPFKAILEAAVPFTENCRKIAEARVQGAH